jgi:outer membrane lipoprotein-sorting protein
MYKAGALLFMAVVPAPAQGPHEPPGTANATEVVHRMVQMNQVRAATLKGYAVTQRYVLDNGRFNRHAELTARMTYTAPDKKQFVVLSETGSSWIRNRVFRKLMQAEVEGARETQITPDNYHFEFLGTKMLDGRSAYLLETTPKTKSKLLFRGCVWVDAEDAAVARIEGGPAQNPSFWTAKVNFVHRNQKHGPYWLAASNVSETEVRIFGPTELKIEYFDYDIKSAEGGGGVADPPAVRR